MDNSNDGLLKLMLGEGTGDDNPEVTAWYDSLDSFGWGTSVFERAWTILAKAAAVESLTRTWDRWGWSNDGSVTIPLRTPSTMHMTWSDVPCIGVPHDPAIPGAWTTDGTTDAVDAVRRADSVQMGRRPGKTALGSARAGLLSPEPRIPSSDAWAGKRRALARKWWRG